MELTCSCLIWSIWNMQRTFRGARSPRGGQEHVPSAAKRRSASHIPSEDLARHEGLLRNWEKRFTHSPRHKAVNQPPCYCVWSRRFPHLPVVGFTFRRGSEARVHPPGLRGTESEARMDGVDQNARLGKSHNSVYLSSAFFFCPSTCSHIIPASGYLARVSKPTAKNWPLLLMMFYKPKDRNTCQKGNRNNNIQSFSMSLFMAALFFSLCNYSVAQKS